MDKNHIFPKNQLYLLYNMEVEVVYGCNSKINSYAWEKINNVIENKGKITLN